jgi:hypothetical protein
MAACAAALAAGVVAARSILEFVDGPGLEPSQPAKFAAA